MTDRQLPKSVLARGALLLRACGDAGTALSLAELAQRSGLPKPTVHRLVGELVRLGLVERTAEGSYRLGMLDGMVRLLPTAEVGFLGMIRNEETLQASTYASRMPEDLSGRQVYVLDPMLATGGTLVAAIRELIRRGADDVTAVVLLAAPEGVEVMERELAGTPVTVVTAAVDDHLNEHGYIVPGLGDAGDRLYGAAE
ncbi:uracil phosphoribosyltransferase [Streptomyces sp. NPDC005921]